MAHYFVTQKTGTDKAYYETHVARDYEDALRICRTITRYYPSTCEIIVLNNGHLTFTDFTHSGDVSTELMNDDFIAQPQPATAA